MHATEYARRYAQAEVEVSDPKRLLLLMLEGGVKFLHGARDGLAAGDLPRFMYHSQKAQAIISELLGTLNYEAGGEIARNLARLYDFMLFHMTDGTARKSVRHYDEVLALFETVAGAYREVLTAPAAQGTTDGVAA
jgi:flagellar protein FliS